MTHDLLPHHKFLSAFGLPPAVSVDEVQEAVSRAVEKWLNGNNWNKIAEVLYRIDVNESVFERARSLGLQSKDLLVQEILKRAYSKQNLS